VCLCGIQSDSKIMSVGEINASVNSILFMSLVCSEASTSRISLPSLSSLVEPAQLGQSSVSLPNGDTVTRHSVVRKLNTCSLRLCSSDCGALSSGAATELGTSLNYLR
jgi:hypothetical protein